MNENDVDAIETRARETLLREDWDARERADKLASDAIRLVAELRSEREWRACVEPTICWDVECHHQAEALDMLARGQTRVDELRTRAEAAERERDELRKVVAALAKCYPIVDDEDGVGCWFCSDFSDELPEQHEDVQHNEWCPWRKAVAALEAKGNADGR